MATIVGSGIVDQGIVDQDVVLGALIGAIAWKIITWWYGTASGTVETMRKNLPAMIWMFLFLIAAGYTTANDPFPIRVAVLCYITIALGTVLGGWRIVNTIGQKITKLKPVGGYCAETGGAVTLFLTALLGIPVRPRIPSRER